MKNTIHHPEGLELVAHLLYGGAAIEDKEQKQQRVIGRRYMFVTKFDIRFPKHFSHKYIPLECYF